MMDANFGEEDKNCLRLGEWLIEKGKMEENLKKDLAGLRIYRYSGGSPTLEFFAVHETKDPNATVSELKNMARELRREDILLLLEEYPSERLLSSLKMREKQKIAKMLDMSIPGVYGWEKLAIAFGYNYLEREEFRKTPQLDSPTEKLIEILKQRNQNLPLELIIRWAESESRYDISSFLKGFINKINTKKASRNT